MTTTHVTIIAPGNDAADVRANVNAAVPDTYAYGVDLVTQPNAESTGRAWDGPLPQSAIDAAREAGQVDVYVRGVDAESMGDAIEQSGYQRDTEEI